MQTSLKRGQLLLREKNLYRKKKNCASGNIGSTSAVQPAKASDAQLVQKRPAPSSTEEPLTKNSIALGASFKNRQRASDKTSSRTPGVPQVDTSADRVVRDATSEEMVTKSTTMTASSAGVEGFTAAENVWMCFACMLKLGVLKKRIENEDKHTCVDCGECPQGIYLLNRHECSGPCTSATSRETSIVPGVPAYRSNKAKTGCESRQ